MLNKRSPELSTRTFFYKGMRVRMKDDLSGNMIGVITHLLSPDPQHPFWAKDGTAVDVKLNNKATCSVATFNIIPDPRPACPLNDPKLKYGPYTEEQWREGQVALRDAGNVNGYFFQPERFTNPEGPVTGVSSYLPGYSQRMPLFSTRDEAVNYLHRQGLYGHVLRYAADMDLLFGRCKSRFTGCDEVVYSPPYPWITAGVTDVVDAPDSDTIHVFVSVMSACSEEPPRIHRKR